MLAGDMLLSVPGPDARTRLRLPSQPRGIVVPSDPAPRYVPVAMLRKIFVVNDHLAVGAAGSALHIVRFLNDLTAEFSGHNEVMFDEVTGFLDRYAAIPQGRETMAEISALMLVEAEDRRGTVTAGLIRQRKLISERFGSVISIGSGSESIIHQIQRFDTSYRYGWSQPADGELQFPEFRALAQNLMLLANVYWSEFVAPNNLFESWGGAYDLIFQDSHKAFRYLDSYTVVLRLFDVDRRERGIQLMNVFKYERRPDVSFIAMLTDHGLELFGAKDITASTDPVTVTLDPREFTMNSKVHISIVAVGKDNRFGSPMIQIDGLDPAEQTKPTVFTWFDDEGRLCVAVHADHDEWLQEQAMSYYEQNAHSWL